MTNIQAAIGVAQLEQIEAHLAQRRVMAQWYHRHLGPLSDLVNLPVEEPWARHSFWMYTITLNERLAGNRDDIIQMLAAEGIETRPVFYPMHVLPPHADPLGSYPVADDLSRRGINLPSHGLLKEEDVAYIAATLKRVCAGSKARSAVQQ